MLILHPLLVMRNVWSDSPNKYLETESNHWPRMLSWVLNTDYDIFIFGSVNYLKSQVVVKSDWTNCHINSTEDSLFLSLHRLSIWTLIPSRPKFLCEHMSALCFLSFPTFAYRERGGGRKVWMSQQGWGSLCSKMKRHIWMSNTGG